MTAQPMILGAPYRLAWCGPFEAAALSPAELRAWLHPEELAELSAMGSEKRRRDRVAGRVAAKRAVRAQLLEDHGWDAPAAELLIVNDHGGRPRLVLPRGFPGRPPAFSLSHAACGAVGAAAAPGRFVGVDLETIAARPRAVLAFAASPDELTPGLLADPFAQTRLWTGKEAVLKLLGLGLDADPRMVEVDAEGRVRLGGAPALAWRAAGSPGISVEFVEREGALAAVAHGGRHG